MEVLKKNRAGRNRTLTVTSEEIVELQSHILYPQALTETTEFSNRLINSNIFDVIDGIPDGSANLIIIDPPYNLSKAFNSSSFTAKSDDKYEEYLRTWFPKVCAKLAPNGSLYMCGDWKCSYIQQKVISEYLTILNRITWQREKGRGASANWKNGMEDIWFAVKNPNNYYFNVQAVMMKRKVIAPYKIDGKPKDWDETSFGNYRITYPSNFWDDISIPFWSMPENTDHPTQKPEKLYAKLILASSEEGDNIFDPFLGSGTTAVVAKKLKRHYFGIEINHEYCLWAIKRIINSDDNPFIQGYSDGVFWERNSGNEQKKPVNKHNENINETLELNFE